MRDMNENENEIEMIGPQNEKQIILVLGQMQSTHINSMHMFNA